MKLQTAGKGGMKPQELADRCRALSQKICKVYDPLVQCIHCKNAEKMLLGSRVDWSTRQALYVH